MAHQIIWNSQIIEEFTRLAGLSVEEVQICNGLMRRDTAQIIGDKINKSESRVNHMVARLKIKYDHVQPLSQIMPPRKKSSKELYK